MSLSESANGRRHRVKDAACVLLMVVACSSGPSLALMDDEKQPTFLTGSVGESVVFNCQLEFPHDIVIPYILRWNKDGNMLFSWYDGVMTVSEDYAGRVSRVSWDPHLQQFYPDADHQTYGKAAVNLTSIRESDQGWYECRVYFPNRTPNTGRNGTWFHLSVDGGTLLAIPPINQTTMEGDTAHFKCVTKEDGAKVTWFKDGVPFSELPSLTARSRISSDGSLTISPTDMADPGYYHCEVSNDMGEKQSAGAHLNVEYKAKVIYSPSEQHLPHGRPGLLDCHFRANPPLTYLRWEKDGFLFDPYNVQGVFLMHNGSLYFNKVDGSHGGMYTCIPYNELGTEGPSQPMRVLITRPPVFTIKPNNLYVRKVGETLSMPCDARHDVDESALTSDAELGVPPPSTGKPSISWTRKDGALIPHSRSSISGGNLTIVNVQKEDRGFYQCVASNEASTITAEAELMIENVAPRAPYNLTANSTLTTISLRWVPGYRKPKQEYSVWYRREDSSEWKTLKILSMGTREAVVPNLNPGTTYDMMVLSQDVHGDGMFSKAIRVRTKGTSPHSANTSKRVLNDLSGPFGFSEVMGPPKNVTITVHSEGYLVSWQPPEPTTSDLQEVPTQLVYTLRWAQGSQEHVIGKAETADTSFLVQGLEEDQTYHFQVVAIGPGDALSASSRFVLHVPPYRRMKAIMVGVLVGISFLLLAAVASYFGRRAFLRHQKNSDRKIYNMLVGRQGHGGHNIGIPPETTKTAEPLFMIKQPTVSTTLNPFEIGTKSVKQCIQFYYLWKKVCPDEYRRLRIIQRKKRQCTIDQLSTNQGPQLLPGDAMDDEDATAEMILLGLSGALSDQSHRAPGSAQIEDMRNPLASDGDLVSSTSSDNRLFVCEYSECSASSNSRAALNGHIRIHGGEMGRTGGGGRGGGGNSPTPERLRPTANASSNASTYNATTLSETLEEFPCKICGKVFSKVKSRCAHMKSHRPPHAEPKKPKLEVSSPKMDCPSPLQSGLLRPPTPSSGMRGPSIGGNPT